MYIPEEFNESDQEKLIGFVERNSLGIVISTVGTVEPLVTHIPFLIKKDGRDLVLEAHIAKANKQSEQLKKGKMALVIFQGPDAYISSSVYGHMNVPTWNYQAVHIHGIVEVMNDDELLTHLAESVQFFESVRHEKLSFKDFLEEMIHAYLKEITGFRLRAYKIEGAWKMSQNRNEKDYQNIVQDLDESPFEKDREVSKAMTAICNHKKR